ncbi:MAG TPA: two-component regulator propeller domain-containing protein [Chitinophagaceae bacterium]
MAKKWTILVFYFILGINAPSQKIFFDQLTTAEGLPSDYVNCVYEDSKGNLWVGTDKGACRYNGKEFQYFSNDNGLPSNFISCFTEDPTGNIWIGTLNAGVCIFDGKDFRQFSIPGNQAANVTGICFNKDNSFFITCENFGLTYFPGINKSPQLFRNYSFIKKIEDQLFFTGVSGQLSLLEKKGDELLLHPFTPPVEDLDFFSWLSDNSVIVFKENAVLEYGIEKRKWVLKNEFRLGKNIKLPSWLDIKKILIDDGELFVATPHGLIYADDQNRQFHYVAESGLGTNYIRTVYKTRRGGIYIGTYGAGIKKWPAGYISEYKVNGKITSIDPSSSETYLTTTKSVYRYDVGSAKLSEFNLRGTDTYTSVSKTNGSDILLGTLNDFYRIPVNRLHLSNIPNLTRYRQEANSGVSGFAIVNDHIYVSTYGDGIFTINELTKELDTIDVETNPPAPLIVESLVTLGHSLAALTYNSGLTFYTPEKKYTVLTKQQGLLSNTVYSVFAESDKRIWIGTKNGLNLFDGNRITATYSSSQGFIGTNVLCIFKDSSNRLWILSDRFLHLVDNENLRAVRSHPVLHNEQQLINRAAFCRDINRLYIGLTDAMLLVDMGKVIVDTVVHMPVLSAILRDSINIPFDLNQQLSVTNPASKISFRFANTDHWPDNRYDIFYKLDGFDESWKHLDRSENAFYQALPSGEYKLLAKTVNADGYASSEILLVSFEVLPPVWKRNWFIGILSVILLALFFFIGNQLSKRRYRLKLRHLEEEYRLQLERERIARELHDNVGSQLTYLINKIDDDYVKLAEKNEAEKLSGVARGAMQELRETIWALDKKEVHWDDLHNKIRQLILLYKRENHQVELDWQADTAPPLNPSAALNIYRIIQEALNNIEKYSHATVVKVTVAHRDNDTYVEIFDNGKGFDPEKTEKGYGLKNIRKRAEELNGHLQIQSQPGAGTKLILHL